MAAGETVVVACREGDRLGVIRERWFGPVSGESYIVDTSGGFIIAPVATVRRPSESEAL